MQNHALDIIDMLYTMIAEAWGVPLGNDKCIVERDKALGLLDDLKAQLPGELGEARRLMMARDEFVASAKQEAEIIRRQAEEEARVLVEKESIYQNARLQADETILNAETKAKEIRRAASVYLDEALRQTEDTVTGALENIRQARAQFRAVTVSEPEGTAEVTMADVEDMADLEDIQPLEK